MSMNQTDPFLGPVPLPSEFPDQSPQIIFHFMYDQHYRWETFTLEFPNATAIGLGCLKNWTWHINVKGEANVRRNFSDTPYGDFMAKGTFGFVFRVTKEDDEKLHAKYSEDRVRTVEYMAVKTPEAGTPSGMAMLPVTFYWDPRNTCDGPSGAKSNKEEQIKWNTGLSRLKTAGVPPWYIARIVKIALGVQRDENPIYVNPQALFYTPPTTTQQPAPPQLQPAPTRPSGQTMIGRAEEAIPIKPQSTPAPAKPANRPQPSARSQSDPNRTRPNIKFVKKRLPEDSDDGGQPQLKKKKILKKPLPGPSSLRKSSLA